VELKLRASNFMMMNKYLAKLIFEIKTNTIRSQQQFDEQWYFVEAENLT